MIGRMVTRGVGAQSGAQSGRLRRALTLFSPPSPSELDSAVPDAEDVSATVDLRGFEREYCSSGDGLAE